MDKVSIKIKKTDLPLPEYKTPDAAGCDLRNAGPEVALLPGKSVTVPTGIFVALPDGYEGQVRGRSGLNAKFGIVVFVGTIDADYRGEIKATIYNLGENPYIIGHGERIAQLVIGPVVQAEWEEVDELESTKRGENGFGSTGKYL